MISIEERGYSNPMTGNPVFDRCLREIESNGRWHIQYAHAVTGLGFFCRAVEDRHGKDEADAAYRSGLAVLKAGQI